MDGIAVIQSRVATIENRFGVPQPPPVEGASGAGSRPSPQGIDSFSSVYSNAVRSLVSPTPATRLAPGAYGRLQPPAELVAFGNGQIPVTELTSIGVDDHHLHAPAAEAFTLMRSAASAVGVNLGVISSYRDFATQQRLVSEKGLYSRGGMAAAPGTSNHGWGLSLDLDLDAPAQAWMRDNAWKFGFVEDVPREPWHWTYRPAI